MENWVTHPAGASTTCVPSLGGPSCLLAGFPTGKIASKDKEFPANLNDWNAIFFNDSAEMPDRKPCEFGGGGNVQKHLRSSWIGCRSLSQYHSVSSLSTRFMHLAFQCANPSERVMTGRKPKTKYLVPMGFPEVPFSRRMDVELCQEADKQES
jgi:hypothetical protein